MLNITHIEFTPLHVLKSTDFKFHAEGRLKDFYIASKSFIINNIKAEGQTLKILARDKTSEETLPFKKIFAEFLFAIYHSTPQMKAVCVNALLGLTKRSGRRRETGTVTSHSLV
jgi:hypothetical protein